MPSTSGRERSKRNGRNARSVAWTNDVLGEALGRDASSIALRGAAILGAFLAAWIANRLIARALAHEHPHRTLPPRVLRQALALTRVVVFVAAAVVALSLTKLPVAQLLTSLGVVAVLTAFLANQLLANLVAGVVIIVDRPFGLGDRLEMAGLPGTVNGPFEVKSVGLRATRLSGAGGAVVLVPNVWFLANPFVNRSATEEEAARDPAPAPRGDAGERAGGRAAG